MECPLQCDGAETLSLNYYPFVLFGRREFTPELVFIQYEYVRRELSIGDNLAADYLGPAGGHSAAGDGIAQLHHLAIGDEDAIPNFGLREQQGGEFIRNADAAMGGGTPFHRTAMDGHAVIG